MRGVNGITSGRLARLHALRLGPITWTNIDVVVNEGTNPSHGDGLLGMDLLSHHALVIDGPSHVLYLARSGPGRD